MFKNLNAAIPATNGVPFSAGARPTADQRAKTVTKLLLGTGAVVLTVCGGIGYLLYSQINSTQAQIANLVAQEQSSAQITGRYQTTLEGYNDTANQLQSLESSLPPAQYIPTLLQQLQALAISTQLQVVSVKPGPLASTTARPAAPPAADPNSGGASAATPRVQAPAYDTQPIELCVSGTYRQIMKFLYALPNFPKILSVQSVALSPKGQAPSANGAPPSEPQLSATLLINAYVFTPSDNPTTVPVAGATPLPTPTAAGQTR